MNAKRVYRLYDSPAHRYPCLRFERHLAMPLARLGAKMESLSLIMESILETKVATGLQFIHGLRGSLPIAFEEGTCAAWLRELLKPHVTRVSKICWQRARSTLLSNCHARFPRSARFGRRRWLH